MILLIFVGIFLAFLCAVMSAWAINVAHNISYSGAARRRMVLVIFWLGPVLAVIAFSYVLVAQGSGSMPEMFLVFLPIALVGPYMWVCNRISEIAQTKGRNRAHYLWFATLIGPLISGILVILMQDKQVVAGLDLIEDETYPCPMCAEAIRFGARKCRYCGEWLDESMEGDEVHG